MRSSISAALLGVLAPLALVVPLVLLAAAVVPLSAVAPLTAAVSLPSAAAACEEEPYRQFDFWAGSWSVTDSTGAALGTSRITHEAGGCALREAWSGGSAFTGTSLNHYDPRDGRWHQHWVGSDGLVLRLAGGLEGDAMVLEGERTSEQGTLIDRIAWRPLPDGTVRQEWTISSDGGLTWSRAFLGFYRPA